MVDDANGINIYLLRWVVSYVEICFSSFFGDHGRTTVTPKLLSGGVLLCQSLHTNLRVLFFCFCGSFWGL